MFIENVENIWLMRDESKIQKHWHITYAPCSFLLNLSTEDMCVRQGEKEA